MTAPAVPLVVPIAPVNTAIQVGVAHGSDGTRLVQMNIHTPSGVQIVFMPADYANDVVGQLQAAVREAVTGLVVPTVNGHDVVRKLLDEQRPNGGAS